MQRPVAWERPSHHPTVNAETLAQAGLIRGDGKPLKVLGEGEVGVQAVRRRRGVQRQRAGQDRGSQAASSNCSRPKCLRHRRQMPKEPQGPKAEEGQTRQE